MKTFYIKQRKHTEISLSFALEYEWHPGVGLIKIEKKSPFKKKKKLHKSQQIDSEQNKPPKLKQIPLITKEPPKFEIKRKDKPKEVPPPKIIIVKSTTKEFEPEIQLPNPMLALDTNFLSNEEIRKPMIDSPVSFKPIGPRPYKDLSSQSEYSMPKVQQLIKRQLTAGKAHQPDHSIELSRTFSKHKDDSIVEILSEKSRASRNSVGPSKFKGTPEFVNETSKHSFVISQFPSADKNKEKSSKKESMSASKCSKESKPDNIFKLSRGSTMMASSQFFGDQIIEPKKKSPSYFFAHRKISHEMKMLQSEKEVLIKNIDSKDPRSMRRNSVEQPKWNNEQPQPLEIQSPATVAPIYQAVESMLESQEKSTPTQLVGLPKSYGMYRTKNTRSGSSPHFFAQRHQWMVNVTGAKEDSIFSRDFDRKRKLSEIQNDERHNLTPKSNFLQVNTSNMGGDGQSQIENSQDNAFMKSSVSRITEVQTDAAGTPRSTSPLTQPAARLETAEIKAFIAGTAKRRFSSEKPSFGQIVATLEDKNQSKTRKEYSNGDSYYGDFKDGERSGQGVLKYADGSIFQGGFLKDLPHGEGEMKYKTGDKYKGHFTAGKTHGKGHLYFSDGSSYQGSFSHGKMSGLGTLVLSNGEKYEGEFKDNLAHGFGKYTFVSGHMYTGEVVEGKLTGHGVLELVGGAIYKGHFLDGFMHGEGVLTWKDGMHYKGGFKHGYRDGFGTIISRKGKKVFEGYSKAGLFHGHGVLKLLEGEKYEGEFKNNHFDGIGELRMANKAIYKGEFRNGVIQGRGIERYQSGDYYMGHFENSLRHGPGVYLWKDGVYFAGYYKEGKKHGPGMILYPQGEIFKGEFLEGNIKHENNDTSTILEDLPQHFSKKKPSWLRIRGDFLTSGENLGDEIAKYSASLLSERPQTETEILLPLLDSSISESPVSPD